MYHWGALLRAGGCGLCGGSCGPWGGGGYGAEALASGWGLGPRKVKCGPASIIQPCPPSGDFNASLIYNSNTWLSILQTVLVPVLFG